MKFQLETIPVYDAWAENSFCPICTLMEKSEKKHVEFFLGNSVMNPASRVKVNETGFCPDHFKMLKEANHPHHLGLICHTHLQKTNQKLKKRLNKLKSSASAKNAGDFYREIIEETQKCLLCDTMKKDLDRYTYTAVILYIKEKEFRQLFNNTEGPCLPHSAGLVKMAHEVLKKKDYLFFQNEMIGHLISSSGKLEKDILNYTHGFDTQYDNTDLSGSEDAHIRTIEFLSGREIL